MQRVKSKQYQYSSYLYHYKPSGDQSVDQLQLHFISFTTVELQQKIQLKIAL